jgi:hypothetical protein
MYFNLCDELMKLKNYKKVVTTLSLILIVNFTISCKSFDNLGFYQPMTFDLTVPDGTPEFKAGWYAGCRSALGVGKFTNAWVYQGKNGANFGSGIYQHDPMFQTGYSQAWFICAAGAGDFVFMHSTKNAPLE